uniref:Uncharacterized protein n=1 Tax=Rhizophora mucronata TaxID=61149 RepID=A0A2P2QE62_RHIMU
MATKIKRGNASIFFK